MKIKILFLTLFVALSWNALAQKYTISGFVTDSQSGEYLLGANIYENKNFRGVASNAYGFYSLTLESGEYDIVWSFVGYQSEKQHIVLDKDIEMNVQLKESIELEGVEIVGEAIENNLKSTQMSVNTIPIKTIKNLPVLLGEVDIIKTIQLLPGVQSGREGSSGLYVRGGGPDQNLILLDGVPVYNANHLFGFFSVFNADAINSVSLIKGGFPARYGGRLSSVLDIRMKEGNSSTIKGSGSVGLISSKLTLEGPIWKEKTSFMISGRRTYLDVLMQPFIGIATTISSEGVEKLNAGYYFYDLNGKINHKFSNRSRLYLSAYTGKDKFYARMKETYNDGNTSEVFKINTGLGWGNLTTSLRWNYLINKKIFLNTTAIYSRYNFGVKTKAEESVDNQTNKIAIGYNSGINDLGLKLDFDYQPIPEHNIKFGISSVHHTYNPGVTVFKVNEDSENIDTTFGNKSIRSLENTVYIEDDFEFGGLFKANVGVNYSHFNVQGENYQSLQPRLALRAMFTDEWSWKVAYSRMTQYLHLLTNSNIGLPTDLWVPATARLKPMNSDQIALGTVYRFNDDYSLSIEGYYKTMTNLIEYKEGASFLSLQDDWQDKVVQGKGWSYGMEVLFQKEMGPTTGWIGYTLSWTERQFDEISFGKPFPYKYDRRHDVSIVLTHKFNENLDIGASWVYGTGISSTMALEQYQSSNVLNDPFLALITNLYGSSNYYYGDGMVEYFESRNNFRMPAYHRLDLSLNLKKETSWGNRTWSFGVYNAYWRNNPFFLMYDRFGNSKEVKIKQISIIPFAVPFISYKFEFGAKK